MFPTFEDWTPPPTITSILFSISNSLGVIYQVIADIAICICNAITASPCYKTISSNRCVNASCEAIKSNPNVVYFSSSVAYTYKSIRRQHAQGDKSATRVVKMCWYIGILCGMAGMMYLNNTTLFPANGTKIVIKDYSIAGVKPMLKSDGTELCCRRVEVVGLPGSGTNWLQYNLRANLKDISVTFKEQHGAPVPYETSPVWKHTFISQWHLLEDQTFLVDDTFFIVIVRRPETWIQTVARTPRDYTQVYTDANVWTSFNWTEIDAMDIIKLPEDGGAFEVADFDKPILIRVSTTKSDRPAAIDRLADRWVVFPNIVEAWNEFHRGWLEALSPPVSNDTKQVMKDAMDKLTQHWSSAGLQLPEPQAFHHPGGWNGVFLSYEALLDNTASMLQKLEKIIRANVKPRDLKMSAEQRAPKEILGLEQKWFQSGNYIVLASHVPVVSDERFEELMRKPVKLYNEVKVKINQLVSSVSAQVEKRFI